jgi:PAS domain S-box-containing protein
MEGFMMGGKPTYEELEQRIKELESEIDKRKQAKEALRDSEAWLKALSEASFEAIFLSEKGVCLDQNRTAERMFGYTHKEAVGRNDTEWIIPEDRERVKNNILSGHEKPYEVTALRKDGTTFSCKIQSWMIDCQGRSIRITTLRNITEHEKALAERITLPDNILKNTQDIAIVTTDLDFRINCYNPMAEKLFGYAKEEVFGKTVQEIHAKEKVEPERFEHAVEIVRREGQYCYSVTQETEDGPRYRESQVAGIFDPDGKMVGFSLFSRDVTKAKKAEAALRQRERYLVGLNEAAQALLVPANTVPFQEFVDKIGPASDAGRTYVFINHHDPDGGLLMSQKAEWCAEGISPEIDNPQLQGLSYDAWFPRWKDTLEHGDIISGPVSGFPADEREILDPQDILAILIIPIMVDGEFVGFIGFDNCVSEREWDAVAQTFLRVAASDLAQAVKRARSRRAGPCLSQGKGSPPARNPSSRQEQHAGHCQSAENAFEKDRRYTTETGLR